MSRHVAPCCKQTSDEAPNAIASIQVDDSLSLGRIAGIKVGLNWSLLLVVVLIAWSLASGSFPSEVPGRSVGWYWVAGLVAAILFIASLLAHELAHSLVAQRLGVRVDGITLWLFGGISRLSGEANSRRLDIVGQARASEWCIEIR